MWHSQFTVLLVHTHSLCLFSGSSWSSMYSRDSQLSLGSSCGTGQWECVLYLLLYLHVHGFLKDHLLYVNILMEVCIWFKVFIWLFFEPCNHFVWLFGKYCSTVLSVTKSTDSHFLLYPLDLCTQVCIHVYTVLNAAYTMYYVHVASFCGGLPITWILSILSCSWKFLIFSCVHSQCRRPMKLIPSGQIQFFFPNLWIIELTIKI